MKLISKYRKAWFGLMLLNILSLHHVYSTELDGVDESDLLVSCLTNSSQAIFISMKIHEWDLIGSAHSLNDVATLCEYLRVRGSEANSVLKGVYSNHPTNTYVSHDDQEAFAHLESDLDKFMYSSTIQIEIQGSPVHLLGTILASDSDLNIHFQGATNRRCWVRNSEQIDSKRIADIFRGFVSIDNWQITYSNKTMVVIVPDKPMADNYIRRRSIKSAITNTNDWFLEWIPLKPQGSGVHN
jgi:hypothetical protein